MEPRLVIQQNCQASWMQPQLCQQMGRQKQSIWPSIDDKPRSGRPAKADAAAHKQLVMAAQHPEHAAVHAAVHAALVPATAKLLTLNMVLDTVHSSTFTLKAAKLILQNTSFGTSGILSCNIQMCECSKHIIIQPIAKQMFQSDSRADLLSHFICLLIHIIGWVLQNVQHSATKLQGRQLTLNTAAVHWCLVTEHLYAESGCA